MKKASPFYPGTPIPIEYFVGRGDDIKKLAQLITQTAEGKGANLFITGEHGIGKSSLARLASFLARRDNEVVPKDKKLYSLYCSIGAAASLQDICQLIVKSYFSVLKEDSLLSKARRYLAKYLESLRFKLFGLGLEVNFKKEKAIKKLPLEFHSILYQLWKLIKKTNPHYKGLMLILDDIDRACTIESFASFLKSLIEQISSQYKDFPLLLVMVGESNCLEELNDHHPSISTLFQVLDLSPLLEEEAVILLTEAFKMNSLDPAEKAIMMIAEHSGGLPLLLHEIGEAVYWCNKDGIIDEWDTIDGLVMAADSLGMKQFRHLLYKRIKKPAYRRLLFHMAKMPSQTIINTKLLSNLFSKFKRNMISSFIRRMVNLGVLQKTAPGSYRFSSQLLRLYLLLAYIKEG